jgi:PhnB protein
MVVIPTFHFKEKRCAEAIMLYKKAFGLTVDWQGVDEDGVIYHTEARIGSQRIRMSDGGFGKSGTMCTDSLFLTVVFDTTDEVDKAFDILRTDATDIEAPHKPDFATYMSSLTDKFGVKWYIMVN